MANKFLFVFKNRQRFGVLMICVIMATLAWLLVVLGKQYTTQLRFALSYTNAHHNYILHANGADTITVEVSGSGFNLLRTNFTNSKMPLLINLQNLQTDNNNTTSLNLNEPRYYSTIKQQIPYGLRITNIQPNIINFTMSKKYKKRVPISFSALLSYAPKFFITDAVTLKPKSVVLFGDSAELNTIREIKTENFTTQNLQATVSKMLHLQLPKEYPNLTSDIENVNVTIKVEEFTEAKFTVPIKVVNVLDKKTIKTFPDRVEVVCLLPLSKYKNIVADNFEVVADYAQQQKGISSNYNNNLKLTLSKLPQGARNAKLSVDKVEFIYKNNVR